MCCYSIAASSNGGHPMSKPASASGDHLKTGPDGRRAVEADVPARQAVTGHNVRVVLVCGLLGAIVALIIVYALVWH